MGTESEKGKKILLIDGHSVLNRAFFGIPDLTNSEGLHTNAIYGFLNILFKILDEEEPDYLTVAFDRSEPTFRHKMYAEYKGTRKPMAEELRQQVPIMKDILHAMGIATVEKAGLEADDILGTISVLAEQAGMTVSILSGDRDLLQLATDRVKIRIPKTKRTGTEIEDYNAKEVKEKYLVSPKAFIDVKALMGDSSDNIPGVPGIGEKGATAIIAKFGSIENAFEHVEEVTPKRARTALAEHYDLAVLSKTLATIDTHAEFSYDLEQAALPDFYTEEALLWFKRLEFKNMIARFSDREQKKETKPEELPVIRSAEVAAAALPQILKDVCGADLGLFIIEEGGSFFGAAIAYRAVPETTAAISTMGTANAAAIGQSGNGVAGEEADTAAGTFGAAAETVAAKAQGENYMAGEDPDIIAIDTGTDRGMADAADTQHGAGPADGAQNVGSRDTISCVYLSYGPAFSKEAVCIFLQQLGSAAARVIAPDIKAVLKHLSLAENGVFDINLAAYLLNPLKNDYVYEDIAKDYLDEMVPGKADLLGKLKIAKAAAEKPEALVRMGCSAASVCLKAADVLLQRLEQAGMRRLYEELELPLVFVLDDMEKAGVRTDGEALAAYGQQLTGRIGELEQSIWDLAGEEFNINSPKQLGVILFEKLLLPYAKRTKTGYSTAADVLEKLAPEYPIAAQILEYRQLTKLKSTYADGLVPCIAADGRIHTTFNQTITATGRLSSTDPNLQNIPIRMELGRQIRRVFIPAEGYVFLDADYSQIELRVLAHMSEDENLIAAYKHAEDIHRITASQVFHVPPEEVTPLQRRNAKAVNFGIVYGISSFGLSQDLSISRKEAENYITSYFETFPGIKSYLDRSVREAKKNGYSETLFGRRRPIPELSSGNYMQRQFGERIAMNSPIQGTAADIIKIAMLRVHRRLRAEGLRSRLILQVHDELLIETAPEEIEAVRTILEEEMRGAADLSVELEIDCKEGTNWLEAH